MHTFVFYFTINTLSMDDNNWLKLTKKCIKICASILRFVSLYLYREVLWWGGSDSSEDAPHSDWYIHWARMLPLLHRALKSGWVKQLKAPSLWTSRDPVVPAHSLINWFYTESLINASSALRPDLFLLKWLFIFPSFCIFWISGEFYWLNSRSFW